jgi:hypothetical protein
MLQPNNKLYLVTCFGFILLVISVGSFSAYGVSSSPSTFFKGSIPYGVTYEDWMTKWWQWNVQIPKEQHPQTVDGPLIKCPVGESGSVSFLTQKLQGKSEYRCTIPAGHAIMIPISTGECTSDEAQSSIPANMMKCATVGNDYLTFDATVDGVRLNGLELNEARSKVFNMTVPEDNYLGLKPGKWEAVTGGYFAFLKPLPVGNHSVSISARVTNPIDPSYNYNYHTLYLLKIG